ncbi:MAG: hypothetical protein L6R40_003293 [Gallowayella cf. fulva]|nr:MAG: hypothetical protein L6R40_003293 [Xanthomendoza cf. fulva]
MSSASDYQRSSPTDKSGISRKRKLEAIQYSDDQPSDLKRSYNTKYHGLLNDTIRDCHIHDVLAGIEAPSHTHVGISSWSTQDNELFFRGISRYGKDNLPAIATLVGTKSEPEVHAYIQTLQAAGTKQHMYGEHQSLVGTADVPAAVEISEDCCASLEQAADSLALLQQRHEEHSSKQKHFELWRLDQDKARWVEQRMCESEEGKAELYRKLPAAEILNLDQMLKLSRNLFMNGMDLDSNWRSYCSRSESPAILYTAFSDLYNVALSTTRRLIQSSLFFAMSRLRAIKSPGYAHQRAVKYCDVLAALRVMGMKENANDTWVHVARRCKLEVYDQIRVTGPRRTMDYIEVERILSKSGNAVGATSLPTSEDEDRDDDHDSSEDPTPELDSASLSGAPQSSRDSSFQSNTVADRSEPAHKLGKKTDAYLDYIDQNASRKEELRLWKILGRHPSPNVSDEEARQIENPGPYRRHRADMDDWRGRVNARPEWEAYDAEHLQAHLTDTRKQVQSVLPKLATSTRSTRRTHQIRPKSKSQSDELSTSNFSQDANAGQVGSSTRDPSSDNERSRKAEDSSETRGP